MSNDLQMLADVSARLGANSLLIQGAGGNTSVKDPSSDTMWIKASGKWLVNAREEDMFVPVHLSRVRTMLSQGQSFQGEEVLKNNSGLRPSIETTLHAALDHPVVIHVHGIHSLTWLVQKNPEAELEARLSGLNWILIPYSKPGIELARQIQSHPGSEQPDIVLLKNHGVVAGAESAEAAAALIAEVESRLELEVNPLESAITGQGSPDNYRPAAAHLQGLAFDRNRLALATQGSLYPDHVVFLGPGLPVYENLEQTKSAESAAIVVDRVGVFVNPNAPAGTEEMLECLVNVLQRLPSDSTLDYLTPTEEQELLNWDAEQYRQYLAKQTS